MNQPKLLSSIKRLVEVGAQAGMSVQQMIDLLNVGLSVEALLLLIELRLEAPRLRNTKEEMPSWKM